MHRHSAEYGPVTIAGQSQPIIGDVTADIGGSATTDAVTGNVSKAITSLGKAWSRKNVTIGQADVGKQVTDGFARLVVIGLVYRIMLMLLVPLVTFFAPPLAVIGGFVALAVTGHALDLSALIGLLMLSVIVVTNAIVLRDLTVVTNAISPPLVPREGSGGDLIAAVRHRGHACASASACASVPPTSWTSQLLPSGSLREKNEL